MDITFYMFLLKIFQNAFLFIKYFILEILYPRNILLVKATSYPSHKKIIPCFESNIGDDINYILASMVFGRHIIPYQYSIVGRYLYHCDNVLFVGSTITGLSDGRSIIIGAGLSPDQTKTMIIPPKKIESVRGPLTKKYLEEFGISCPAVFGDPVLVMPLLYTPVVKRKYKVGFVPHFLDRTPDVLKLLSLYEKDDCIILNVNDYGKWMDFINLLCSCELILSSSLHGLIFADTYNIPNVWTHFSYNVNPFKYQDYFLSVGRSCKEPYRLNSFQPIEKIQEMRNQWKKIDFDRKHLLDFMKSAMA